MKFRSSFSVSLMVSASLIVLTACDEPKVDASVFKNIEQCKKDPMMRSGECETSFKEARNQHAAVAPKYTSQADCQADFGEGKCEPAPYRTSGGGSVFMPMMMGYMMGSMLGGRRSMMSQPLYRSAKIRPIIGTLVRKLVELVSLDLLRAVPHLKAILFHVVDLALQGVDLDLLPHKLI